MTGVVTAIIRRKEGQNGGYGFIRDEQNQERFFHARNLGAKPKVSFEKLREGMNVEFTPVSGRGKGNDLSAENLRCL